MLFDQRNHGLSAKQNTHQIDIQHPTPVHRVSLFNRSGSTTHAGIVDQHMYLAELLNRLLSQVLPQANLSNIHRNTQRRDVLGP